MPKEKSPFESEEFLKLRAEWYAKLKAEGFEDIEYTDWESGESGNLLKGFSHMDAVRLHSPEAEEYYSLCRKWLWDIRRRRPKRQDRKKAKREIYAIWSLYCDGASFRDIESQLGISRHRVSRLVKAEERRMYSALKEPCSDSPTKVTKAGTVPGTPKGQSSG